MSRKDISDFCIQVLFAVIALIFWVAVLFTVFTGYDYLISPEQFDSFELTVLMVSGGIVALGIIGMVVSSRFRASLLAFPIS